MKGILIIVLFILQLISFFLIVLLNAKLNKYKHLEVKQNQLMDEMDNAIGAYLMEMKEENDRLIQELSSIPKPIKENHQTESLNQANPTTQQKVKPKIVSPTVASNVYKSNIQKQAQIEEEQILSKNNNSMKTAASQNEILNEIKDLPHEVEKKEMSYEEFREEAAARSAEIIINTINKGW